MVKLRQANYCNLKLLLIFLVVYGHLIEEYIYDSEFMLIQYRFIYFFHMPVFVFLSGLFLGSETDCIRQLRRLVPVYLVCQGVAVMGGADPTEPCWVLWYLLSLGIWVVLGALWFCLDRIGLAWGLLPLSVLVGALAGYLPFLDRTWSASRTVVFFPYFFAGLLCSPRTQWRRYRAAGIIAGMIAVCGIWLLGDCVPVSFLYHASGYGNLEHGFALRMSCYGIGALMCFFLLTWIPGRRFPVTKAGADTMPVYLVHAPVVTCIRWTPVPWICCVGLSVGLIYAIYRIASWRGPCFGVVTQARRGKYVRISRNL